MLQMKYFAKVTNTFIALNQAAYCIYYFVWAGVPYLVALCLWFSTQHSVYFAFFTTFIGWISLVSDLKMLSQEFWSYAPSFISSFIIVSQQSPQSDLLQHSVLPMPVLSAEELVFCLLPKVYFIGNILFCKGFMYGHNFVMHLQGYLINASFSPCLSCNILPLIYHKILAYLF